MCISLQKTTDQSAKRDAGRFWQISTVLVLLGSQVSQATPACPDAALQPREAPRCGAQVGSAKEMALPLEAGDENQRLTLYCVEWHGNAAIDNGELDRIASPFINRPVTQADLERLRNAVSLHYVKKGYISSGATICPQQIKSGIVHMDITEGLLSGVDVEVKDGDLNWLHKSYIQNHFVDSVNAPLNADKLFENFQLLLRDVMLRDPVISHMKGEILPDGRTGQSKLRIYGAKAQPYQLYARTDNYVTPAIGGFAARVGGKAVGLTALNEQIDGDMYSSYNGGSVGFNTGIELPAGAAFSSLPFGWNIPALFDITLSFRYTDSDTSLVEKPFDTLDVKTRVSGYDSGISYMLYRGINDEVATGANLAIRQSNSTLLGSPFSFVEGQAQGTGTSQSTAVHLWQQYVVRREQPSKYGSNNAVNHAFIARSTFKQGLDALGATVQKNELLPSSDAFSWLGQTSYIYSIRREPGEDGFFSGFLNHSYLAIKSAIQLAESPLLPLDRMPLGGVASARGYRENFFVRDNAFNASIEFHWELVRETDKKTFQIIPFMDYGGAWNNRTIADRFPKKECNYSAPGKSHAQGMKGVDGL